MPVSNAQQLEIDKLADKAIKAWEWSLGTDVNPSIIRSEDLTEAYENVRAVIRDDIDTIAARAGQRGWSENTLRGNFFLRSGSPSQIVESFSITTLTKPRSRKPGSHSVSC